MKSSLSRYALLVGPLLSCGAVLEAQQPGLPPIPPPSVTPTSPTLWDRLPVEFNGAINTMSEFYRHAGDSAGRRPAAIYRVSLSPQLTLFGEITMGLDVMVSSEGSELRQNVNQFGLNPTWRWVTVHMGDFTRDYSPLTMQGTRLRGAGIDLRPGNFFFSLQGGRAQRTVAAGSDGAAYRRDLMAVSIGYGREGGNRIALTALKAKDDPNSLEQQLVVVDSTVSDTTLVPDPLRFATSPQENLVVGLQSELNLFRGIVHFKGEGGASLFTRDLRSETIGDNGVGALGPVSSLQPLRLSTSGDAAYITELDIRFPSFGIRGGLEQVGPGYTSLGIPNLISDRRGYNVGGNVGFFSNRLSFSGETRWQANNLADQRTARTERSNNTLTAVAAISPKFIVTWSGTTNEASTAASSVTPAVDLRTITSTSAVSSRLEPLKVPTTVSVAYSYQESIDYAPQTTVPGTIGHNVTATITAQVTPKISLGPSLSRATNKTGADAEQVNLLAGFNLRAKLLDKDKLTLSGNMTNTFSSGRQVKAAKAEASYTIFWDSKLVVQARHSSYSAFASRPAFDESFLTLTLSRSLTVGHR